MHMVETGMSFLMMYWNLESHIMSQITKHSIILKMKDKDKYDNEREIEELA